MLGNEEGLCGAAWDSHQGFLLARKAFGRNIYRDMKHKTHMR